MQSGRPARPAESPPWLASLARPLAGLASHASAGSAGSLGTRPYTTKPRQNNSSTSHSGRQRAEPPKHASMSLISISPRFGTAVPSAEAKPLGSSEGSIDK